MPHDRVHAIVMSPPYWRQRGAVRLPMEPSSVGRLQRAMDANMGVGGFVISSAGYTRLGRTSTPGRNVGRLKARSATSVRPLAPAQS